MVGWLLPMVCVDKLLCVGPLVGWSVKWSVYLLVGWSVGWSIGWSVDHLVLFLGSGPEAGLVRW